MLNLMSHDFNPRSPGQVVAYRALNPKLQATRNLCMLDVLKFHRNCDAKMGVQKERKSTFLTVFEHRDKEARSLFAAQYFYRSCL